MNRPRLLNIAALSLVVLIVAVFAAIGFSGAGTPNQAAEDTPTAASIATVPHDPEFSLEAAELPVQIGPVTLTRDTTDSELMASNTPSNSPMHVFNAPTPNSPPWTYIMSIDEANSTLGQPVILPTLILPEYTTTLMFGGSQGPDGPYISTTYNTAANEHALVFDELHYNSGYSDIFPIGEAAAYRGFIHGHDAVYVENANLGWIPSTSAQNATWAFNMVMWEEDGLLLRAMSDALSREDLIAIANSSTTAGLPKPADATPSPVATGLASGTGAEPSPDMAWFGGSTTIDISGITAAWFISEIPAYLALPPNYSAREVDRRSDHPEAFAAYDIRLIQGESSPALSALFVSNYDTVKVASANCVAGAVCTANVDDYTAMNQAWASATDYQNYVYQVHGGQAYLTRNTIMSCDTCGLVREYIAFFGNMKADLWVTMLDESQVVAADQLVEQIRFLPVDIASLPIILFPLGQPREVLFGADVAYEWDDGYNPIGVSLINVEDSRCASDVQCVQAGMAKVTLQVGVDGTSETITLEFAGEPVSAIVADKYKITVVSVNPYPTSGHDFQPSDYSVTLIVDHALTN